MAKVFIDDWKIIPRLMMLAVTVLTYQSVHWYMSLPDPTIQQSGLVSVCMGALTGCFGMWLGKSEWLLGSLLGFTTSFAPEVLGYFRANQEHKHSLEKAKLEMDLMSKRSELKLELLDKEADIKEAEGLYKHDSIDAGGFINALGGSVRPVITYMFLLYSLPSK